LDKRLEEFRAARGEAPLPHFPEQLPLSPGGEAAFRQWAEHVDTLMLKEVGLNTYPLPPGFRQPLRFVENEQAMHTWITRACGLGTQPEISHLRSMLHISGQGTIVNLGAYPQGEPALGPGEPHVYARFAADLAQERWGWGFIMEYTALGQAAGREGLWPALACGRLGLSVQAGKAQALQHIWRLTAAGGEDWVRQFVMIKARHAVGDRKPVKNNLRINYELIAGIAGIFPLILYPFGAAISLRTMMDLFSILFLEQTEIIPDNLNALLVWLQDFCEKQDKGVAWPDGKYGRAFGGFSFSKLEAHIGILCTPHATLIACHNECLDLHQAKDGPAILALAKKNPRANPDTRLALLSGLNSRVKYNPQAMSNAAWETLRLDGPGGPVVQALPHPGISS